MRQLCDTEVELIGEIERLEMDASEVRHRLARAEGEQDKGVLSRQLDELERQVDYLRWGLKRD